MKTSSLLFVALLLILAGCTSTSGKKPVEVSRVRLGSDVEVGVSVGKTDPSLKSPGERQADRYEDRGPFKDENIGITGSWKF